MDVMSRFSFELIDDSTLPIGEESLAEPQVQTTPSNLEFIPRKALSTSTAAPTQIAPLRAPMHPEVQPEPAQIVQPVSSVPTENAVMEKPISPNATESLFEAPAVFSPLQTTPTAVLSPQAEAKLMQFAAKSFAPVRLKPAAPLNLESAVNNSAPALEEQEQTEKKSMLPAPAEEARTKPELLEVASTAPRADLLNTLSFEEDLAAFTAEVTGAKNRLQALAPVADTTVKPVGPYVTKAPRFAWKRAAMYVALFFLPIAVAGGVNIASSTPGLGGAPLLSSQDDAALPPGENIRPSATQVSDAQPAKLAAANNDKGVEYELSLSSGFLRKAVQLSNSTTNQTAEEKNRIIGLLNQALEAANRAIQSAPNDARAYTTRGRVYQATSVVKPEMKAMADADFAKARELGASAPTAPAAPANPMELLPTEQANAQQTAMIAGPNGAVRQTVAGTTSDNANKGTVTLQSGEKEIVVAFPGLKADTKVYVQAEGNSTATFYVKNKEAGKGFTIAATEAVNTSTNITWWEIL